MLSFGFQVHFFNEIFQVKPQLHSSGARIECTKRNAVILIVLSSADLCIHSVLLSRCWGLTRVLVHLDFT